MSGRPSAGSAVFCFAAAAALLIGQQWTSCGQSGFGFAVAAAALVAIAAVQLRRSRFDLLGLGAVYMVLAVPVSGYFQTGCDTAQFGDVTSRRPEAGSAPMLIVLVFFAAALFTDRAFKPRRPASAAAVAHGMDRSMSARWVAATLLGWATLLRLTMVINDTATQRSQFIQEGQGWLYWVGHLAIIGPPTIAYAGRDHRPTRRLAAVMAVVTMLLFFMLGGRARSLMTPLATGVVLRATMPRQRRRHLTRSVTLAALALVVLVYLPAGRTSTVSDVVTRPGHVLSTVVSRAGGFWLVDVSRIDELSAIAVEFGPSRQLRGKGLVGIAGPLGGAVGLKGASPGRELFRQVNPEAARLIPAGPVPTLPGHGFIEFGWAGVVLFGAVFGYGNRRVQRLLSRPGRLTPLAAVTWAFVLFAFYTDASKLSELVVMAGFFFALEAGPWLASSRRDLSAANSRWRSAMGDVPSGSSILS